jgi:hypothetical protein
LVLSQPVLATQFHHSIERGIQFNLVVASPQGFQEAARGLELLWPNDCAFGRAPPHDGLMVFKPGEYAMSVSIDEAATSQVSAHGQ